MLYERRFGPFFVEPIVAGLDPVTFKPYICNMVSKITLNFKDFCVRGSYFFAFRTQLATSLSQSTSWLAAPARSSWWACAKLCGSPRWSQTSFLSAFRRCSASSLCCQFYNCTCFQAVMNAMDRDAISGWGAVVHIIEKDKVNLDSKDVWQILCPLRLPPEPWKPGWTKAPFFFTERTTTTKVLSSDHLCPMWTSSGPHMSQNKVRKIPESKCPNFRGFEIWKASKQ